MDPAARSPGPFPSRREFLRASLGSAIAAGVAHGSPGERRQGPAAQRATSSPATNSTIGVAIVGMGNRGTYLLRAHGLWSAEHLEKDGITSPPYGLLPSCSIRAVCDVYQPRIDAALATCAKYGEHPVGHRDYRRVLEDKSVDAVLVSCADVWHAPIAIAALEAGKDVYVEKCMTNSFDEAKRLRETVRRTGRVLQVGHQNRHSSYHETARELIHKGTLGPITVIQTALNRGTREGAYVMPVPKDATPQNLSWELFMPPGRESTPFNPTHLFTWRRYWAYSTGIAGDLLSHEIDAAMYLCDLDVPDEVTASGGVYFWRDGRETPDVYTVIHEHKDRGLTFTYNATLANSFNQRKTWIMGREATLALQFDLSVYPDWCSTRYAKELAEGKMFPDHPFILIEGPPGAQSLSTSPTLAWADGKGLTFTYVGSSRLEVSRLAIEEFHECIRSRKQPRANVDEGFKVAAACHMGTKAYLEGRRVRWDRAREEIV